MAASTAMPPLQARPPGGRETGMQATLRAEFHQNRPGKVKLPTCGLRVGERVCVRMPTCNHSVLITVRCGPCTANQLCVCENLVMTFNAAGNCNLCTGTGSTADAATGPAATAPAAAGSATTSAAGLDAAHSTVNSAGADAGAGAGAASDAAGDATAAANASSSAATAASAASAASASGANSALEEPPAWWDSESDERFAECLYVAQMAGDYIEDRFYKQDTHLKQLFPTVGLAQWLHAKEWVQQEAQSGGIAARRRALGKSKRLRFVDLEATRPARRRTRGAPDSSGATWQTDDGARLYQDEDGCVYKAQPGQRAVKRAVLALCYNPCG